MMYSQYYGYCRYKYREQKFLPWIKFNRVVPYGMVEGYTLAPASINANAPPRMGMKQHMAGNGKPRSSNTYATTDNIPER